MEERVNKGVSLSTFSGQHWLLTVKTVNYSINDFDHYTLENQSEIFYLLE